MIRAFDFLIRMQAIGVLISIIYFIVMYWVFEV